MAISGGLKVKGQDSGRNRATRKSSLSSSNNGRSLTKNTMVPYKPGWREVGGSMKYRGRQVVTNYR